MPELPSGTVTFLFTDIEGSTALWEQHPGIMEVALESHDVFLRTTLEAHGGYVFKTIGDAFCAAFDQARDALRAAVAIQCHLTCLPPSAAGSEGELAFKVRIVLDTGLAQLRDGDYFGATLSRADRLRAIAHGGQVLLSQASCDLVQSELPTGAGLLDLGWHRLRDILRPEHVYQLLHPDLPHEFPPLRSRSQLAHHLPQRMTRFIGRERELADLKRMLVEPTALPPSGSDRPVENLRRTRLLTLTGAGGTGKSRLALQLANGLLTRYEDGVWLVELASLTDPALVPPAVAEVLKVREESRKPLLQTLIEALRERHLLLILDNCEHLLDAAAYLVESLLSSCPQLSILATSRARLGLPGEQVYRVPPLSVPDPEQPASLLKFDAVQLFVDRAALVQPDFALTPENAPAVAQLCHQLDGIPLAIELAAFRLNAFSVHQIARAMEDRFRLLKNGSRAAVPRQQTLRALIDWSYDLLSQPEQALFRRLAVFAGGFTLEAAEAVCGDFGFWIADFGLGEGAAADLDAADPSSIQNPKSKIQNPEVLDLLGQLVDQSMVLAEAGEEESRFRMLGTIRQYAWERLWEADEGEALCRAHRDWCLIMAEQALAEIESPNRSATLRRLMVEYDNLRSALGPSSARVPDRPAPGVEHPRLALGRARVERWSRVVEGLVLTYRRLGRVKAAQVLLEEYLAVSGAEGYGLGLARTWTLMASFVQLHPELGDAGATHYELYERAITVCEAHGLQDWAVYPRSRLAEELATDGRDLQRAEALIRACPPEAEVRHDVPWLVGVGPTLARRVCATLMWIATHRTDWEGFKHAFQASLPSGGPHGIALRPMLDKIEESSHQRGQERLFHELCDFMAQECRRAGLDAPFQQWYLEPVCTGPPLGEPWIEERFGEDAWHPALRWQDATGGSRIERAMRPGWLGVVPASNTNLWPETDLNAPRLVAELEGDFVAQARVELEPGTHVLAGLLVWRDDGHFARLELQSLPYHPERASIQFAVCISGRFYQIGRGQCDQQATWLRFERIGDELVGLCSMDGEQWLACGHVTMPRRGNEQVGLACIPYSPGGCAWFETFRLWRVPQ